MLSLVRGALSRALNTRKPKGSHQNTVKRLVPARISAANPAELPNNHVRFDGLRELVGFIVLLSLWVCAGYTRAINACPPSNSAHDNPGELRCKWHTEVAHFPTFPPAARGLERELLPSVDRDALGSNAEMEGPTAILTRSIPSHRGTARFIERGELAPYGPS